MSIRSQMKIKITINAVIPTFCNDTIYWDVLKLGTRNPSLLQTKNSMVINVIEVEPCWLYYITMIYTTVIRFQKVTDCWQNCTIHGF